MSAIQGSAQPTSEGESAESQAAPLGFQVRVNGVSLVDLLQMFHMGRRSVTVRLPQGMLYLREGEVIHAESGELTGEEAVRRLLEVRGGELCTESLIPTPISVRRPLATVLLDALVRIDEHNERPLLASDSDGHGDDAASTRIARWEAICEDISRRVEGALCSVVVDLSRRVILGGQQRPELAQIGQDLLLDVALALFSANSFSGLEEVLDEGQHKSEAPAAHTRELYTHRGERLYIGKRLPEETGVLVVCAATSLPALPMAQLKSVLASVKS
jgi:hypothetical protein